MNRIGGKMFKKISNNIRPKQGCSKDIVSFTEKEDRIMVR